MTDKEKAMQRRKILLLMGMILILALACNIDNSTSQTQATQLAINPEVATSVEETLRASNILLSTPIHSPTPTFTPTPSMTPTPSSTPTPSIPIVSVSLDTNCRTGPGKIYDYIGALLVGEKAVVVGKHTNTNYWIIKNPDRSGNCWLWGSYATVTGDKASLQEYAVPATPTAKRC